MTAPGVAFDDLHTRALVALCCGARTVADVADALWVSRSTAHGRMVDLVDAGLVAREPRKSATWRPLVRMEAV